MRKILYISSLTIAFIILLSLNTFFDYKVDKLLFDNKVQIVTYDFDKSLSNDELKNYIKKLSDENEIYITKYKYLGKDELVIYTNDLQIFDQVKSKVVPKGNGEYITDDLLDKNYKNIGNFKKLNPKLKTKIMHINDDNDLGNYSSYIFSFKNSNDINNFKYLWGNLSNFKIVEKFKINFYPAEYVIFPFILFFLIFINVLFTYAIISGKELSVLKLNGYSFFNIIKYRLKKVLSIILIGMTTGIVICTIIFFIITNNIYQYIQVFLISITILLIFILITTFIDILFISYLLIDNKLMKNIKGKKSYFFTDITNYVIKFLSIILCFLVVTNIYNNINIYKDMENNLVYWNKFKDINKIVRRYVGENVLEIEMELMPKFNDFYEDIVRNNNAFIINASNYSSMETLSGKKIYDYELNSSEDNLPEIDPNGKTIIINENYLKINPIKTINNNDARDYIIYDDKVLNILVPQFLKQYESEIKENFIKNFYFEKVEVENIYNEKLNKELYEVPIEDLSINIIYVANNQKYFSFDPNIEIENNNMIVDPISKIFTNNINKSFVASYLSNSVFFVDSNHDENIKSYIEKNDLYSPIGKSYRVYAEYINLLQKIKVNIIINTIISILLLLLNFFIIFSVFLNYLEKNKFKITIKELFGYKSYDIHKNLLILNIIINIIAFLISFYYLKQILILYIFLGIIIFDVIYFYLIIAILKHKEDTLVLKGDM
nr:DUF1430 domain-containing protein [uncultured Tyzzerella sp.]